MYKASHFKNAIAQAFGLETRVSNMKSVAVTLLKKNVGRYVKPVTLNYYPSSGVFMLTGNSHLREQFENYYHELVENGPIYPTNPQLS